MDPPNTEDMMEKQEVIPLINQSQQKRLMSQTLPQLQPKNLEILESPKLVTQQLLRPNTSPLPQSRSPRSSPKGLNVAQIETEEKADRSRLQKILNLTHPKKKSQDGKLVEDFVCYDACCGTTTGQHNCCSTSVDHNDMDKFGIGITLYFRFIKVIGCYYFIFLFLSIPQIILSLQSLKFYYKNQGASEGQGFDIRSIQQWLIASTIGSIGIGTKSCSVNQFQNGSIQQNFSCNTGQIDFDYSFTVGTVTSMLQNQSNCALLIPEQIQQNCKLNSTAMSNYSQQCNNQSNCSFLMKQSDFDSSCNQDLNYSTIYTNVFCKNSYITIFNQQIPKYTIPTIVASFDTAIIILFIFMLISLRAGERDYVARAIFECPQIQYFTIQFSNLPNQNLSEEQLKAKIWNHIEKYSKQYMIVNKIPGHQNFKIFDIKISESKEQLILQQHIRQKELKQALKVRKFLEVNNLEVEEQEISFEKLESLLPEIKIKQQKSAKKQLIVIQELFNDIIKSKAKQNTIKNQPKEKIKYLWATFLTQEQASIAQEAFSTTPFDQMILFCCPGCLGKQAQNQLVVNDKEKKFLTQKPATNPDNIIWENIYYTTNNRNIRQIMTWILTIIILFLSLVMIVSISNYKTKIIAKYPSIDCSLSQYNNITQDQVITASTISNDNSKGYVDCYCQSHINDLIQQSLQYQLETICQQWFGDYSLLQAIPIAAVFCIIIINVVIQFIFQGLSQFEKFEILSDEYTSRVLKIFLAQFLNTGLIILLSNANFGTIQQGSYVSSAEAFILGGKYDDLNSDWYKSVGIVVLLTILINIVTTPIQLMIELIYKYLQQCCDRGCSQSKSKTNKQTMDELVQLYNGPEFLVDLRYAQILNISFVCMMYGAGMPILYLFTSFTIMIFFWIDKIFLFLFYQKPSNFDSSISKRARYTLFFICVIHCAFAIFIYGNQNIFYNQNYSLYFKNIYGGGGYLQQFWQRLNIPYTNWALTIVLVLSILFFLIVVFFITPFKKLLSSFGRTVFKPVAHPNFSKPITHFLTTEQMEKEVKFTQYYIEESQDQDYKDLLKDRQQYLIDFLNTPQRPHSKDLEGIQSYDIAYNNKYLQCFDWQLVENICIIEDDDNQIQPNIYDGVLKKTDIIVEV